MPKMDHVIVLMLENRSFDHMLGFVPHLRQHGGLTGTESNPDQAGQPVTVSADARYEIKGPDHSHTGVLEQLGMNVHSEPRNDGFIRNYDRVATGKGRRIMRSFDPRMVPVLAKLAESYATCTRWFSSVPGNTWPNREFLHSGTSRGRVDNSILHFESTERTVFELLDAAGATWRIYHKDTPHTWNFPALWDTPLKRGRFQSYQELDGAIRNDRLPSYAFVEPDYGLIGVGNSQHPSQANSRDEFLAGERLIHTIYTALRETPQVFEKTVFIITYDEHGGFYDHVPPPATVPPDGRTGPNGFGFDLLGVRVPTVVVSPWVPRGHVDDTVYDHASVIQTLRTRFAPSAKPLTQRDRHATPLQGLLNVASDKRPPSDWPQTHALSPADGRDLEKQIAAPDVGEGPVEEQANDLLIAMQALREQVAARLGAPQGDARIERNGVDRVAARFRDGAIAPVDAPADRARLRELVKRSLGGRGGLESMPDVDVPANLRPHLIGLSGDLVRDRLHLLGLEAIIKLEGRPVVDIVAGSFARPPAPWEKLDADPIRARLERAIACVGRIEVPGDPAFPYVGTGFLLRDGLVMTNRHVAESFATRTTTGIEFLPSARHDVYPVRFVGATDAPLAVVSVVHIDPYWDMALLRVEGAPPGRHLELATVTAGASVGRSVAAIGYPARDPRNDAAVQARLFRDLYQVKRLSPGETTGTGQEVQVEWGTLMATTHDCSTLGGNSGSPLVDIETGLVVGLHLGGEYLDANYACPAAALRDIVEGVARESPRVALAAKAAPAAPAAGYATASAAAEIGAGDTVATVRVCVPLEVTVRVGTPVVSPPAAPSDLAPALTTATSEVPTRVRAPHRAKRDAVRAFLRRGEWAPVASELTEAVGEVAPLDAGPVAALEDAWAATLSAQRTALDGDERHAVLERLRDFYKEPDRELTDVRELTEAMEEAILRPEAFYDRVASTSTASAEGVVDKLKGAGRFIKNLVSHYPMRDPNADQRAAVASLQQAYSLDTDIAINPNDHKFEFEDPGWWHLLLEKGEEWVGRWPGGLAPFREHSVGGRSDYRYRGKDDTARIALLADFGTGRYHARHIARQLERHRYPDVFHLGDVYYGGSRDEFDDHFDAPLDPVLRAGSRVFGLPENHELYGEGVAYLAWIDRQRKAGRMEQEGSYFAVSYPEHLVVAVDVNWNGRQRFTHPSSRAWLRDVIATKAGRTVTFLTGSAPYGYGSAGPRQLLRDVGATIDLAAIDLWFWGDDHYAALFDAVPGAAPFIGSCIGHGGYPGTVQRPGRASFAPVRWLEDAPRFPADHPIRTDVGNNGWCELGFAAGGGVDLRYVDWLSVERYRVSYRRGADGRLAATGEVRPARSPAARY